MIRHGLFCFLLVILINLGAYAQLNLVPNCGFEEHFRNGYRETRDGIFNLLYWRNFEVPVLVSDRGEKRFYNIPASIINKYKRIPDYFNLKSNAYFNSPLTKFEPNKREHCFVPLSAFGYQNPFEGSGYLGIELFPRHVYTQVLLKNQLKKDKHYRIKLKICLAECSQKTVDAFPVFLTSESYSAMDKMVARPLLLKPVNNSFIKDTLNWVEVSADYLAKGDERFLLLGCLNDLKDYGIKTSKNLDMQNSSHYIESFKDLAYYFIDDVSIIDSSENIGQNQYPNVYDWLIFKDKEIQLDKVHFKDETHPFKDIELKLDSLATSKRDSGILVEFTSNLSLEEFHYILRKADTIFSSNKIELTPESFVQLDSIADFMLKNKKITPIYIYGDCGRIVKYDDYNRDKIHERMKFIKDYFVKKGIESSRIVLPKGDVLVGDYYFNGLDFAYDIFKKTYFITLNFSMEER